MKKFFYQILYKNKIKIIIFLILVVLSFPVFTNSVLSADHGFFVVPEDEFYDLKDYGQESSLSFGNENLEKFGRGHELYNESTKKFTGSINSFDFNFALAGDWGCTKSTKKLWIQLKITTVNLFSIWEIHLMERI